MLFRRAGAIALAAALLTIPAVATAQGGGGGGHPNAARLREMVEERFASQMQAELSLSDEELGRVRRILTASAERRRGMEREERAAQGALREQLRPGVAAQADSLTRLLDKLTTIRVAFAQAAKDEMRELGTVLSPVQQAQFLLLRDRMMSRAQDVRSQRPPGAAPR